MSQPIKQIDVLVYPFYDEGRELLSSIGKRKFTLWMRNLKAALKENGTAFLVLHGGPLYIHEKVKPLFDEFNQVLKELMAKNLVQVAELYPTFVTTFKRNGFAKNITIRYYGQHVSIPKGYDPKGSEGACVDSSGKLRAEELAKLIQKETGNNTKFRFKKLLGLSIPHSSYHTRRMEVLAARKKASVLKPPKRTGRRK